MSRPSGSPPPSWYKYPSQGSAVGPPPMPNKPVRSPERERRTSPGYDREAEWRRFQEWEKRNKKSPLRSSPPNRSPPRVQHRPPSPRKERSPVNVPPPEWGRRSPPRGHRPPEWGRRSRSPPPMWFRRSPPRYGPPPRGRSPPQGRSPPRWGPPPPEWDRFRSYPMRRSPPRWGPPPPWDSHRERYPMPGPHETAMKWGPHPIENPHMVRPNGVHPLGEILPPSAQVEASTKVTVDSLKSDDGSAEEEILENYDIPEYDAEAPLGQKYVIAVSGFFCKICHKFYNSESSAKITHCKSKTHYEKFTKWVADKKAEALAQKRAPPTLQAVAPGVPSPVPPVTVSGTTEELTLEQTEEPPTKVLKLEANESSTSAQDDATTNQDDFVAAAGLVVKEEIHEESDGEANNSKYDPSEPTAEDTMVTPAEIKEEIENTSSTEILSDAEKPSTHDGEFVEATLYNFRKMRVHQLKENLRIRDLPVNGLKPLLLKRLEKALLAEAAEAAAIETKQENEEEDVKPEPEAEEKAEGSVVDDGGGEPLNEFTLTMHESDVEVANRKSQWITERELARELLQLEGTEEVLSMDRAEAKMGKKTVVEWTIGVKFRGKFPEDGLNFWMDSHQHLPYRATLAD